MKKIVKNVYQVKSVSDGPDCASYLINTESDDGLVLVDPGLYIEFITDLEKKGFAPKEIKHCLITHGHLDHYGSCYELEKFNQDVKFYAHDFDATRIERKESPEYLKKFFPGYDYNPIKISHRIKGEGEILRFGPLEFKCVHIPGHTPGSVAYFLEIDESKIIFGGDTSGTSLRIYGGNIDDFTRSMGKLIDLNANILCHGHVGVIRPADKVKEFIEEWGKVNEYLHIVVEEDPSNIKVLYDLVLKTYELKSYDFALDFCNYLLEIDPDNSSAHQLYKKIKKHNPPKIKFAKKVIKESRKLNSK
jgi:glyoxylase-like metal-dependent hydrolase (beta-lactamase superfamily II)